MKYLILIIILLIVGCTNTVENEQPELITEEPMIDEGMDVPDLELDNCIDSDGGINFTEFGIATLEGKEYADECFDVDRLREYYCENGEVLIDLEQCQNGVCEEGKCVFKPLDKFGCTETDGGSIINIKGNATDTYGTNIEDYCKNGYIYEAICDNYGVAKHSPIRCAVCEDGTCIQVEAEKESLCSDTDGGVVFGVSGTVVDFYGREYNDTCAYTSVLHEYSCDNFDVASKTVKNCNCYQGRCTD